ncbi:GNAT family N-acetyltransferase [Paenibacillus marinisediminis]
MSNTAIIPILEINQIHEACDIAQAIWIEHYTPIIGREQVDYMVDKFQSPQAVKEQIDAGYEYFFLTYENQNAGYFSIKQEQNKLFLSKLYVDRAYRGKKIASSAIAFMLDTCKKHKLQFIYLTVNKYNHQSIAAYEQLGFKKVDEVVADIGNGYVMDDYIMEKWIEA